VIRFIATSSNTKDREVIVNLRGEIREKTTSFLADPTLYPAGGSVRHDRSSREG
jgi:hypothetical protein